MLERGDGSRDGLSERIPTRLFHELSFDDVGLWES
jgi:hypothetical protein